MVNARGLKLIASCVYISFFSAFAAYYRAFFIFGLHDDEGTLMMNVRRFFDGNALYDREPTVYGPLFYLYQWCVHIPAGIPLTHASVRFVSVGFWIGALVLVFLLVYRATGSLTLAILIHLVAFRPLRLIGDAPAHPQEVGIFLLVAFGLAAYTANRTWRMAWLGALAGAMLATKINLGIFAVVALAVVFAFAARPGWMRTAALFAVSAGALVFPVLLMSAHHKDGWAVRFCVVVVISLASAILTISQMKWDEYVRIRDMVVAGLCCAGTFAAICSFPLAHGSTIHAMVDCMIVKPRATFAQVWFVPVVIHPAAPLLALAGLAFAWFIATKRAGPSLVVKAKLVFAAGVIMLSAAGLHNLLIVAAPPFLWLVAVRPQQGSWDSLTRAILAMAGVMQVLYVYPVAGAQVRFATVFLIAVAGICLWDGLPARVAKANPAVVLVILAAAYPDLAWRAHETYESLEPLGLPGAERLHVEPEKAAALRSVVGQVNASSCGTLVTLPGLFSFNLWTHKPAPAGLSLGAWVAFLSDAEEERIVQEVSRDPHACVIERQEVVEMWTRHGDVSSQPLVRYIHENFQTVFETYGYRFMVRKP